jgi:hypothetical protein
VLRLHLTWNKAHTRRVITRTASFQGPSSRRAPHTLGCGWDSDAGALLRLPIRQKYMAASLGGRPRGMVPEQSPRLQNRTPLGPRPIATHVPLLPSFEMRHTAFMAMPLSRSTRCTLMLSTVARKPPPSTPTCLSLLSPRKPQAMPPHLLSNSHNILCLCAGQL